MAGDVPAASRLLAESCPQALVYSPSIGVDVPFYLHCLHFIELVRQVLAVHTTWVRAGL